MTIWTSLIYCKIHLCHPLSWKSRCFLLCPQADAHFTVPWALRGSFFWSVWQNMVTAAETEMRDLTFLPNETSAGMKLLISLGCASPCRRHASAVLSSQPLPVLFSFLSIKENIVPKPSVKQSSARTLQYTLQHTVEPCRLNVKRSGFKGRENSGAGAVTGEPKRLLPRGRYLSGLILLSPGMRLSRRRAPFQETINTKWDAQYHTWKCPLSAENDCGGVMARLASILPCAGVSLR